jgi:hypothetical protein
VSLAVIMAELNQLAAIYFLVFEAHSAAGKFTAFFGSPMTLLMSRGSYDPVAEKWVCIFFTHAAASGEFWETGFGDTLTTLPCPSKRYRFPS